MTRLCLSPPGPGDLVMQTLKCTLSCSNFDKTFNMTDEANQSDQDCSPVGWIFLPLISQALIKS